MIDLAQRLAAPPPTRVDPVTDVLHGAEIVDPYRWLEDQESPDTRAWIEAQYAHTRAVLDALPGREAIRRRLAALLRVDVVDLPRARGGRYFFSKRLAYQDLHVLYVRHSLDGADEVLVDPHPLSPDHTTSVGLREVSQDGRLVLYEVREGGRDESTIRFLDVDTRDHLPDALPQGRYYGGIALTPDQRGVYYSRFEVDGPRVYYHRMGTEAAGDRLLFGQGYGPDKIIGVDLAEDGRYLLITVFHGSAATKTEVYYCDLAAGGPLAPVQTVVNDVDARFTGALADGRLFLQTDWEAPNGRVLCVDLQEPARERWREVVPEGADAIARDGVDAIGGKLVVHYLRNASSNALVFTPEGAPVRALDLPGIGTVGGWTGRWESDEAFYLFTSFHVPGTIFRYDLATGAQSEWARVDVPIDHDRLDVRQVWFESPDTTRVPMFLVHARDLARDGSTPTLLTGYGGFTVNLTPAFSALAAYWAEQGGVFAVATLRGGGEFGEAWHQAGMLDRKQNVFDDFIAAAEWLIAQGYTQPARLAIAGGSNGGLLVGAALTQRPELCRAVVCTYPLLDMVRYHLFRVARFWVSEYGSADDPDQFAYLHAYSPYHRVRPGTRYPAVLMMSGDLDTRVDPLHARKMVALLQAAGAPHAERPVLLHYHTKAGHSGGRPLSQIVDDLTDEIAFLRWQLGVS